MNCYYSFGLVIIPYIIASGLSLIGSIIVIAIILQKKLYNSYSFKILLIISINDSLRGIIGLCLAYADKLSIFCSIAAYLLDSITLSNYIWSLCITYTIFQIVVNEEIDFVKNHTKWLATSYILPLILEALPLITSSYGYEEGTCIIKLNLIGSIWRFSIYFFPIFVNIFIIFTMFIRIYKKIYEIEKSPLADIIFERGLIYVFVILVVEIPFFILRIVQMFRDDCGLVYSIRALYILFLLQGFANSVIFLNNRSVKESLRKKENLMVGRTFRETMGKMSLDISFRSTINL